MASHQYLAYSINLTDAAKVAELQGKPAGNGAVGAILRAPDQAAIDYDAPLLRTTDKFEAPSTTSTYFTTSTSGYPTDVASFERKSGGWLGIGWLFPKKTVFHWRGSFVYSPPAEGSRGADTTVTAVRLWVDGFEMPDAGEDGSGSDLVGGCARVASRHTEGFGFAIRGQAALRKHETNEHGDGAKPPKTWERFYLRPRAYPVVTTQFWRSRDGFNQNAVGLQLAMTATGQIAVFSMDVSGTPTLIGATRILPIDEWVRVDLFQHYGAPSGDPQALELFLNGTASLAANAITMPMTQANKTHGSSEIGAGAVNTLALDVDDWMCANWAGTDGVDFQFGSKMVLVTPTGLGASASGWTGDWQTLVQQPAVRGAFHVGSSTPSAVLAVTTDAAQSIEAELNTLGVIALVVGAYHTGDVGGGVEVGYSINGGAAVLAATVSAEFNRWDSQLYTMPPALALSPITPLELVFKKGPTTDAVAVMTLCAVAELIGSFGPEDYANTVPKPTGIAPIWGHHNAPYPRTPWARQTTPPLQPVLIRVGTYTGTGAAQALAFMTPIHFLWVRPLTGGSIALGPRWWSSLAAPHVGSLEGMSPLVLVQALMDGAFVPQTGETIIAGDHTDVVATVKADLVARGISLAGDCGAFEIIKRVAWQLRSTGAGLLDKPTGANCQGYATDVIVYPDGVLYDVLVNAGTDNTPAWNRIGAGTIDVARYRAAIDPGDDVPPTPDGGGQQTQAVLRIVGDNDSGNAAGIVYAYLAVGDPGMRFMVNGALKNHTAATDQTTVLDHPGFTPLAAFVYQETNNPGGVARQLYKGPGHNAASLSPVNAAETPNALVLGPAALTSKAALHLANATQVAFSCWRMDDHGPGNAGKVVQLLSYTGNGTGSRSVALVPASGKRPVWAMVTPHNGASVMRDALHTGTTSTNLSDGTLNASTGITGGDIDMVLVGSTLNASGVVYELFVIPGSLEACESGWSCPGEFVPVNPEPPPEAPGPPGPTPGPNPPEIPTEPIEPVEPGPGEIPVDCLDASTRLVNIALSRLGESIQLVDMNADTSPAATQARLHFTDCLEATLRAFPWPFATRYASLASLAGTPVVGVNRDWQYSYRLPANLLFARRLVTQGTGRRYAEVPSPFRVGADSLGPLLYCNLTAPDVQLEYTIRPACAAASGDALFRSAFAWRLAHELAPTLSRDTQKVGQAWAMYERQIETARVVAANESQQDQHNPNADWITGRN